MADYKRLCQEALDHMLADSRLFTDQPYWDACNIEILCHVTGTDVVPLLSKYSMLRMAAVWLSWKKGEPPEHDWEPNSEWPIYVKDKALGKDVWGFRKVSTFPELARKLKGSRHIKVLKEVALYELEQREKEGEDECS